MAWYISVIMAYFWFCFMPIWKHFHHFLLKIQTFSFTPIQSHLIQNPFPCWVIFFPRQMIWANIYGSDEFIWWLSVLIAQAWQTALCPAKMLHGGHWSGQPSGLLTAWSLKYNTFTSLTHLPLGDLVEILLKICFHGVMTVYLFAICIDCPVFANLDSYTNLAMWQ